MIRLWHKVISASSKQHTRCDGNRPPVTGLLEREPQPSVTRHVCRLSYQIVSLTGITPEQQGYEVLPTARLRCLGRHLPTFPSSPTRRKNGRRLLNM